MIDFHGSTGYGQAFTDSISGDWGGKPLEDLKLGLAAALKQYPWLDGDACLRARRLLRRLHDQLDRGSVAGPVQVPGERTTASSTIAACTTPPRSCGFRSGRTAVPEYANPAGYAKFNPVDYVTPSGRRRRW